MNLEKEVKDFIIQPRIRVKKYTQRILLKYLWLPRLHSFTPTYCILRTVCDTRSRISTRSGVARGYRAHTHEHRHNRTSRHANGAQRATRHRTLWTSHSVHAFQPYATSRPETRSDMSPAASSAPMLHVSATSRSRSSKRVRWLVMLTRMTSWPLMRVVDGAAMPRS